MPNTLDDIDPIRNPLDARNVAHQFLGDLLEEVAGHSAAQRHGAFLAIAFDVAQPSVGAGV
jgi:hypothetical protein